MNATIESGITVFDITKFLKKIPRFSYKKLERIEDVLFRRLNGETQKKIGLSWGISPGRVMQLEYVGIEIIKNHKSLKNKK